jgi:hypothetical protein
MSMSAAEASAPISSAGDAERVIADLNTIMDRLVEAVEEETARVRAGKFFVAPEIDEAKVELARRYAAETERVKAARELIANSLPEKLAALQMRHEAFRALLQTNLTVLATAHAVSEGVIRGVSGELARQQAPSTYGASGRAISPATKASQPLALSRTL